MGKSKSLNEINIEQATTINVKTFGATGVDDGIGTIDTAAFNAAAAYAQTLANGTNKVPHVRVPAGNYRINSSITSSAIWWLEPGAEILGLSAVPVTAETDTSRLTGKIFRFSGVDQSKSLTVGDATYAVQKATGRGVTAEIVGNASKANVGVAGTTFTNYSGTTADQNNIGLFGLAVNDNSTTPMNAWGGYFEAWAMPAVTSSPAFGIEISMFTYNASTNYEPYSTLLTNSPFRIGLMIDTVNEATIGTSYDASAAIGINGIGTTAFNRGIVFQDTSITSKEAVVMPQSYEASWYSKGLSGTLASKKVVSLIGLMPGEADGRFEIQVYDDPSGLFQGVVVQPAFFAPKSDITSDCGGITTRWNRTYTKEIYTGDGTPLWTSGVGTPEGVITAKVGSMYTRTDGGANTTLYIKESGTGNTGWIAK